ncbi:hypothetical protein [Ilyobacter polytropus]|uniref:Uncharacterized protein n=1 Tax=Ilyobacter polytropus (strain ATCC 51220 / DSM 2926 / LMG 16218 / CuHBu1) TaxID=572544 RepID=E3H712_ILYPC|nr:hypothetical protein [Ilyobacter polytropus]ADO82531.1 conserved hypothetical protein [Ilyobacter polytropus DSM 2926]
MSSKRHVTKHDIEMYMCEKISKRKLKALKDKFKKEILLEKEELEKYRLTYEKYVYEDELKIYNERNEKNIEILDALQKIFPEDIELSQLSI